MDLLCLIVGGALGTVLRWLVGRGALAWIGPDFPWGTLAVNVVGSLILAGFAEHARAHEVASHWRLFVATGFCGGFTTYSTFNLEVLDQLAAGAWARVAAYVSVTLVGCLVAGWGGIGLARAMA